MLEHQLYAIWCAALGVTKIKLDRLES